MSTIVLTRILHETGGMVLSRLAELARERIQRLVFVDALALLDSGHYPMLQSPDELAALIGEP